MGVMPYAVVSKFDDISDSIIQMHKTNGAYDDERRQPTAKTSDHISS